MQRLVNIAGEDGFWGGWAKVVFSVPTSDPYITVPPQFARIAGMNICRMPVRIQNEWYETLEAGIGLRTECDAKNFCGARESFDRGVFYTAYDLPTSNQKLRVYITDSRDIGKRVIFTDAKDANGNGIYSQDPIYNVIGLPLVFNTPFVTTDTVVTSFGPVLKDQTFGDIVLKAVDQTSGVETFLARYTPDEIRPTYRRYLLTNVPCGCCIDGQPVEPARITCMAKYEFRRVYRPTDTLLIGNIPALIEMCSALRHERMDDPTAVALSITEEKRAVRMLNQELSHYMGKIQPAINLAPWGTAKLSHQRIGLMQ